MEKAQVGCNPLGSVVLFVVKKFLTIEHVPRVTDFCICIYVFGCKLSLVGVCNSDFGITPVDDITIGITCAAFCFHIAHISFASSCFVCRLLFWRDFVYSYVYRKGFLCFLIHKSYVRSIKRYCFVRKCAAIPVRLEIFILQYTGWCVLIIWTFILNQFRCF